MTNFVQIECSPEWPVKAQIIFGEVMPLRKIGTRISIGNESSHKKQEFFLVEERI